MSGAAPRAAIRRSTAGAARPARRFRGASKARAVVAGRVQGPTPLPAAAREPALAAVVVGYLIGTAIAFMRPATGGRAIAIVAQVVARVLRDALGQVLHGSDGPDRDDSRFAIGRTLEPAP